MWKISYPPVNGVSLGSFFALKIQVRLGKVRVVRSWVFFNPRSRLNSTFVTFLSPIMGVCGFFLSVKFATSLTRLARRGINIFNFSLTIGLRYKKLDYLLFLITQSYYPAGIKNYTIQKKIVLDSEN